MTNLTRVHLGLKKSVPANKTFQQAAEEIFPSLDQVTCQDTRLESQNLLFRAIAPGASQ